MLWVLESNCGPWMGRDEIAKGEVEGRRVERDSRTESEEGWVEGNLQRSFRIARKSLL